MSRSWLSGAVTKSGRRGGSPAPRFTPRVTQLEERDVPATFFVDPSATAASPEFNAGRPDAFTGVFSRYQGGTGGTNDSSVFRGICANACGGFAASATGAQTALTISHSTFGTIGRVGAAADAGATLNLSNNTYTGKGAGNYLDY